MNESIDFLAQLYAAAQQVQLNTAVNRGALPVVVKDGHCVVLLPGVLPGAKRGPAVDLSPRPLRMPTRIDQRIVTDLMPIPAGYTIVATGQYAGRNAMLMQERRPGPAPIPERVIAKRLRLLAERCVDAKAPVSGLSTVAP